MRLISLGIALLFTLSACENPGNSDLTDAPGTISSSAADASIFARIARIRAQDAQNASILAQEGELLYGSETQKMTAPQYCSRSLELASAGEFRLAIRAASMGLYLGKESGDHYFQGLAHRDLAYANFLAGDLYEAKDHAKQTLDLAERVSWRRRPSLEYTAHKILGDVASQQGILKEALREYGLARVTASNFKDSRDRRRAFVDLASANAALRAGRFELAEEFVAKIDDGLSERYVPILARTRAEIAVARGDLDSARTLFSQSAATASEDQIHHQVLATAGEASVLRSLGNEAEAENKFFEALQFAEKLRARFRSEEVSSGAFGSVQNVFDEAIDLAMSLGHVGRALEASERSRSRAALDLIRGRVEQRGLTGSSFLETLPVYGVAESAYNTVASKDMGAAVPNGVVIAVYHVTNEGVYVWSLRRGQIRGAKVEVTPPDVVRLSLSMRSSMRDDRAISPACLEFGAKLIQPLDLKPGEHVVFVPHGALHYLPFHAFKIGNSHLVETNSVSYTPSVSILLALQNKRPEPLSNTLIAFGNPVIDAENSALPGAEDEVKSIVASTPGALARLGTEASEAAFIREAPRYASIHVAAHAKVDELDPLYSTIFLSPQDGHDGMLEAHEIYSLDLRGSDMITLSACETGLGRVGRGDEQWGFVRTFLASGARTAIVSFWDVPDEATRVLMERFYAAMRSGKSRSQAMREAQAELLKSPNYNDPFNWAAFAVWGAYE